MCCLQSVHCINILYSQYRTGFTGSRRDTLNAELASLVPNSMIHSVRLEGRGTGQEVSQLTQRTNRLLVLVPFSLPT
jgi:hypothetical protein